MISNKLKKISKSRINVWIEQDERNEKREQEGTRYLADDKRKIKVSQKVCSMKCLRRFHNFAQCLKIFDFYRNKI